MKNINGIEIDRSVKTSVNGIKVISHHESQRWPQNGSTRETANEVQDHYVLANGRIAVVFNGNFERYDAGAEQAQADYLAEIKRENGF